MYFFILYTIFVGISTHNIKFCFFTLGFLGNVRVKHPEKNAGILYFWNNSSVAISLVPILPYFEV